MAPCSAFERRNKLLAEHGQRLAHFGDFCTAFFDEGFEICGLLYCFDRANAGRYFLDAAACLQTFPPANGQPVDELLSSFQRLSRVTTRPSPSLLRASLTDFRKSSSFLGAATPPTKSATIWKTFSRYA